MFVTDPGVVAMDQVVASTLGVGDRDGSPSVTLSPGGTSERKQEFEPQVPTRLTGTLLSIVLADVATD